MVLRHAPNASGVHFLASAPVVARLVRSARVGPGDLVVDLGAGTGAVTAPLAATGARVLAVERDPAFVRRLARRFADRPAVRVVHADVRSVPLPRRPYAVVANLPFAVTTDLLRRLLAPAPHEPRRGSRGDRAGVRGGSREDRGGVRGGSRDNRGGLRGAELIVEWGLAARLAAACPRDLESAWWAARYALVVRARVPARCFAPAPAVDAAHLSIRPVGLDAAAERVLWTLLRAGFAAPGRPAVAMAGSLLPRRRAHRVLVASGIDPPAPVAAITNDGWRRLATDLAADPGLHWPALPRHLYTGDPTRKT
jgi:23S rRNA (adenine-N6)-dimethyltransferase